MKKRSREILSELIQKHEIGKQFTINELAEKFQVSSRSIRNDINDINDYLKQNKIRELEYGKHGLIIVGNDIGQIREKEPDQGIYYLKLSKEDRLNLAAVILICRSEYSTLAGLAEELYVSRSTMIQDLDDLKDYCKEHKCYLFTQSNKGLMLEGEERSRRRFLFYLIRNNKNLFKEQSIYSHLIGCLTEDKEEFMEDRAVIAKIINMAEHSYGRYLTDGGFFVLKTYLELTSFRTKKGYFIDELFADKNSKYDMAKYIVESLNERLNEHSGRAEYEIAFLSLVLNNVHYLKKTTSNRNIVKMQIITRTFIEKVSEEIHVNLENDYEFFDNLSNHLESTFSSTVDNFDIMDIVKEILDKHSDIVLATKKYIYIFEEYIHRKFTEGEISYVAVHICAAVERNRGNYAVKKAFLVCNGGIGTSQILLGRLNRFFHFNHVEIISSHELKNTNIQNSDLVISVMPLKDYEGEYIQVDPLLSNMDYIRLSDFISQSSIHVQKGSDQENDRAVQSLKKVSDILEYSDGDHEKLQQITEVVDEFFNKKEEILVTDLLSPDAITVDVECDSWQDAIRASADYLLENHYVNQNYVERMVQNVMDNGPYIVLSPGFALPHEALDSGAMKVGMSLIRLKTPVPFGKEGFDPVEWVCCLSAIDKEKHLKAMFSLVNLFYDKEYRQRLQDCTTERDIYSVIRAFVYK